MPYFTMSMAHDEQFCKQISPFPMYEENTTFVIQTISLTDSTDNTKDSTHKTIKTSQE